MEMRSHAWKVLKSGPLDVRIRVGPPVPLSSFADRKDLARRSEAEVREHVVRILRARPPQEPLAIAAPEAATPVRSRSATGQAAKWT
jgi:1-acyl-sn-glycerol-3-phosphate acyltransferase